MDDYSLISEEYFTNSALSIYVQCPRKWYNTYIEKLDPYALGHTDSDSIVTGTCLHECIEAVYLYQREMIEKLGSDNLTPQIFHHSELEAVYKPHITKYLNDDFSFNKITTNASVLMEARLILEEEGIVPSYWGGYKMKEETLSFYHEPHEYKGKLDGIVEVVDESSGEVGLYVLDHKSSTWIPSYERYHNSPQQHLYCMLAIKNGYPVKGYIIDGWRTLNIDGGFSPGVRRKTGKNEESYEEFAERFLEDVLETERLLAQMTDEEKKESGKTAYFKQLVFDVDTSELLASYKDIRNKADMIKQSTYFRKEFNNCYNKYNTRCPFFDCCHFGKDISSIPRLKSGHRELEGDDE